MAVVSESLSRFVESGCFQPKIVVDIEGYPLFTTGEDLILDPRKSNDTTPAFYNKIDLGNSDSSVSQQLQLQRGGSSSTTTYRFRLVDTDETFTRLFSFITNNIEILEAPARVYQGFEGGTFPDDFVPFINGTVGNIDRGAGWIELAINHPDKLRKTELFFPASANLSAPLAIGNTSLSVDTTEGFFEPTPMFNTYIRIEDEIIQYTGISGGTFTGISRAQLESFEAAHDDDQEVTSYYELIGDSFELALGLMLSGSGETSAQQILAIGDDGISQIDNAIFFNCSDIREIIGATIGDTISLSSTSDPSNDFAARTIVGYGSSGNNSYYIVDGSVLTPELAPTASSTFTSQWEIYPDGCGLKMHQVDVDEFERIRNLFSQRVLDFNFYLDSELEVSSFLNERVYLPSSFYHIPRRGKNSIGVFNPPLTDLNSARINETNIERRSAPKIVVKRSVGKHHYNYVQYRFDQNELELDRMEASTIVFSQTSINRFQSNDPERTIRNRGIKIETGGLRRTVTNLNKVEFNANRILERYQFAAEEISVQVLFKDGFQIDIGDPVIFGSPDIFISDSSRGDRRFQNRIMQVINRTIDYLSGRIKFVLLDTNYSIFARYGVVSPSSSVVSITDSGEFCTQPVCDTPDSEFDTWCPFINRKLKVSLPDCVYSEEVTLSKITLDGKLQFIPAPTLPSFPIGNGLDHCLYREFSESDLIISVADYPKNDDPLDGEICKDTYVFFNPQVTVVNAIDDCTLEVSSDDICHISIGSIIQVNSPDYSNFSQEVNVTEINSNTIKLSSNLNYTPSIGDEIRLIGFTDGGFPYRII